MWKKTGIILYLKQVIRMSHKFNPASMHKLDNSGRREMLPPEKVLLLTGLKEGDIFLDIGAGIGYFAIPAAEITGESGKVIAADISPEMLDELNSFFVCEEDDPGRIFSV